MNEKNILIVEDEVKIANILKDYLKKEGYDVSVMTRGDTVIPLMKENPPDLILLDLMLPGMDGTEICREIRKFSNVAIIMITAKIEEVDRIIGLEIGSDDYICKPFSPREVVARVKAVMRRVYSQEKEKELAIGPVLLNEETRQVTVNGIILRLTPTEFDLLKLMIKRPGRVFSRNELIDQVQGYSFEGYDRTVDSHIKNLRKKIAAHYSEQEIIHSVYGVGYKIEISVGN